MTAIPEDYYNEGVIPLRDREFRLISELVYERFGVRLTEKKKALVRGRLNSLIKSKGFASFEDYYNAVVNDSTGVDLLSLIDRISTNHSYFFREAAHFDVLTRLVLPEICRSLQEQGINELRIWCAGCAAGEEPYTLGMVLREFFGLEMYKWDIGILATDISMSALSSAVAGIYPAQRLETVPDKYMKYFKKLGTDSYAVDDRIKDMVLLKQLNLMRETLPFRRRFHIIFCRNVMIYFDRESKKSLVGKFHHSLQEGGYLFIGHSESLNRGESILKYIQPTVYKRC